MKMKLTRILSLALAAVTLTLGIAACGGGSSSAAGSSAKLSKAFIGGDSSFIDQVGWYKSNVYTLKVNTDNTYELTYQQHMFGTTDPGIKGMRTVIYTGKCTSEKSADGWDAHVDYKLEPATRIYFEQHEKGYGRSAIAGHVVLDTDNWTDAMTSIYDAAGNSKKAADFLSEFAEAMTITVEDPSLNAEDVSLGFRIVENPTLKLVEYAG